jgi:PAS domain-containing protein
MNVPVQSLVCQRVTRMKKRASSTNSRRSLAAGFGALLILIAAITLLGVSRIYTINQHIEALVDEQNVKSEILALLLTATQQREESMHKLFSARDNSERSTAYREYRDRTEPLFTTLDRLEEMDTTTSERAAVRRAIDAATRLGEVRDRAVEEAARNNLPAATRTLLREALPAQEAFHVSLNQILDSKRAATLDAIAQSSRAMRDALLLVAMVGAVLLFTGAGIASLVMRRIAQSETALEREKEMAQVTLHSIGDGVITLDAAGNVDYMNPIAEQYTGWSRAEATGQPLDAV